MVEVEVVVKDEFVLDDFGKRGDIALAGHGSMTNSKCSGGFSDIWGCINVDLHNKVTLDGVNHAGKVYLRHVVFSCDRLSCPVCYKKAASREARRAEVRLKKLSVVYGLVEHCIVSFPKFMYGLEEKVLRWKARDACRVRGLFGGCLIWHPFRFRNKVPYWSPHYHYNGFIKGGYACRECKFLLRYSKRWVCGAPKGSCNGFEVTTRKFYETDSIIVKVAEERGTREKGVRRTISGTISYELRHCGVRSDAVRFHPLTWFGVASYRKLKLGKVVIPKNVCPLCGDSLHKLECVGDDAMRYRCYGLLPESPDFASHWEEDYLDSRGVPNFIIIERGSGSYG